MVYGNPYLPDSGSKHETTQIQEIQQKYKLN